MQLGDGVRGRLADEGRHVDRGVPDGEHDDGHDDGHADGGEDAQGGGADQLVGVLQGALEGRDGEQGHVLPLLRVPRQVHVHQLLDLKCRVVTGNGPTSIGISRFSTK